MQLLTGLKPQRIELPGAEGEAWVKLRKFRRSERNRYSRLVLDGESLEAVDHLLRSCVVDFLLPGAPASVRANPEDPDQRMQQLEDADTELEEWLIEQCYQINGMERLAELVRAAREGRPPADVSAVGPQREALLGNSGASPVTTGEGASESAAA